jgi:hypothetical protein
MDAPERNDCQLSYDQVADEYVRRLFDELRQPVRRAYIFARRPGTEV